MAFNLPANGYQFKKGVSGNPKGRAKAPQAQRDLRLAIKDVVAEYKEMLRKELPALAPTLIKAAKAGDMAAIKEIHQVIGIYERGALNLIPVQVNINSDRDRYGEEVVKVKHYEVS